MKRPKLVERVSVLVPVYNEQDYIGACLDSLLEGDFDNEKLEILVIDGGSTDRTREIVGRYQSKNPLVRLISNPKKIVPCALNIGAREARGEILVWVGAHAQYATNYVSRSVALLLETGASSVGGKLIAVGDGFVGKSIAYALSLPTGTGNAKYRSGEQPAWVDTVFGGCWWKTDFNAIGGFDEQWVVNQDTEFNTRLRQQIGKLYFSPDITCKYFVRNSVAKLSRQYYRYGFWRARTSLKHPSSLQIRQLLPATFVLTLFISALTSFWTVLPIVTVLVVYSAALGFVLILAKKEEIAVKLMAFVCTVVLHTCWGAGFLIGMVRGQPAETI